MTTVLPRLLAALALGAALLALSTPAGAMPPVGSITEFGDDGLGHVSVVAVPDGNLWAGDSNGITRMTPTGTLTHYALSGGPPGACSQWVAGQMAAGWDGNLWAILSSKCLTAFGYYFVDEIARVTPAGVVTAFDATHADCTEGLCLSGVAVGADHNVWVANSAGNEIDQVSQDGVVTGRFPTP